MPFLASSRYLFRIWRASLRASVVREMEFRANFVAGIIRQLLWLAAFVFVIEVVFQNTGSLSGWSRPEVLVILALSRVFEGVINSFFAHNFMRLPEKVRQGKFDFDLIKPVRAQFFTVFLPPTLDNVGQIISGLILLGYVAAIGGVTFTLTGVVLMCLLGAIGMVIYYSLLLAVSSLVFFFDRLEALWGFNMLFSEPLTVPFTIFPRSIQIMLTYVIPIAFVVFIPAQAVTGRALGFAIPLGLLLSVVFLGAANLAWRAGLQRYSSASS